jgi:hypothetical protein
MTAVTAAIKAKILSKSHGVPPVGLL